MFWDFKVLELLDLEVREFSISCRFRNCENDFVWVFARVYGPYSGEEIEGLWEELGAIRGLWNDLLCVRGDFNVVRFPIKRTSGSRLNVQMRRVFYVINELELTNLPLAGDSFTWCGGQNNSSK